MYILRFCCVPVDFEVANVDSTLASEDDINNAIMSIRRNGVALKGTSQYVLGTRFKVQGRLYCYILCTGI